MKNCIYMDLEVQTSGDEVGGFTMEATRQRKMSVAATFNLRTLTLKVYLEPEVNQLVEELKKADQVIGYNLNEFDLVVLSGYPGIDVSSIKTLDLMEAVREAAQRRYSFDDLVMGTFGSDSMVSGQDLIKLWKNGCRETVIHACCNDVLNMWRLHQHGIKQGQLSGVTKRRSQFEVKWTL